MRAIRILMAVLMATGAFYAWMWHRQTEEEHAALVEQTLMSVERLQREVRVRSAMGGEGLNGRGWPVTIDPEWFSGRLPKNHLVSWPRPWVEIASGAELALDHPRVRITVHERTAAFWYNPANGIVRARVGVNVSDRKALRLYNRVNGTTLASLVGELPVKGPLTADGAALDDED